MAHLHWQPDYDLGIAMIDEQHRWLLDAINKLEDALANGQTQDSAALGEILEGLVDYTMNHFILEEDLFSRYGYPETDAHRDEHNRFSTRIMEQLQAFEDGAALSDELLDFLREWLIKHILKSDRAYAPFMQQRLEQETVAA